MKLSEFYDHVVLRDLLEYTAPGIIVLVGAGAALEIANFAFGYGLKVTHFASAHPWQVLVFLVFFGYLLGHVLTAIHELFFRKRDRLLAKKVLKKNDWLASRASEAIAEHLNIQSAEARNLLEQEDTASVTRELGRAIVQSHLPDLYREYVNRHSILSRFCGNLALAIAVVLLALLASLGALVWYRIYTAGTVDAHARLVSGVSAIVIVGGLLSIWALGRRSGRLRQTMTRHTFELLYLDRLGVAKEIGIA